MSLYCTVFHLSQYNFRFLLANSSAYLSHKQKTWRTESKKPKSELSQKGFGQDRNRFEICTEKPQYCNTKYNYCFMGFRRIAL